jgi:hypothetical protein
MLSKFILEVFPFSFLPWVKCLSRPTSRPILACVDSIAPVLCAHRAGRVPRLSCLTVLPRPTPHRDPVPSTPCTARASPARLMESRVKEESSEGFNSKTET